MKFVFTPAAQAPWVDGERFPATPGMVDFVNDAQAMGFTVFGLTGRSDSQKAHTVSNLAKVGYTAFPVGPVLHQVQLRHHPAELPQLRRRADLQHGRVQGGHPQAHRARPRLRHRAQRRRPVVRPAGRVCRPVLKLPNPTYYLPSPNLPGVNEPWLAPRTHFTMKPDGSSGLTQSGEGIPNIDVVKKTIAVYYGDPGTGISNKVSSPYISEITKLVGQRSQAAAAAVRTEAKHGRNPAIVLDADDTTLCGPTTWRSRR